MKKLILGIFFVWFSFVFSQTPKDSISVLAPKEDNLLRISAWEKQLEQARARGDIYTQMKVLMDMIYLKVNNLADTTTSYEDALELEKLVNEHPSNRAVSLIEAPLNMFLGFLIRDQNRLEESISYFEKGVSLAKKHGQKEFFKDANVALSNVFNRLQKKEKALALINDLITKALNEKDSTLLTRAYEAKSGYFFDNKLIDSSLYYAKKSIDNNAPYNQQSFRLYRIAECYSMLETYNDSVIYYGEKALEIAEYSQNDREQKYAHGLLKDIYGKVGKYEEAFHHFSKFYSFEQEQLSFNNALKIGQSNIELEKERAQLQQALTYQKLSNQKIILWSVLGILSILVIAIIYISNRLKLIKKQNKIIAQEKLRAEQSERYKEQFLANMSHEIRTPMHAISGMLNSLRRQPHPESQNDFLNVMKISADNLLVLLNDVLDMSKIESGNLDIEQVNMNAKVSLEQVVAVCKYKAEEKGLELKMNISPDFPDTIIGDPDRLHQILMNLLSNAIKFTEKGYVEINLSQKDDNLRFTIKDTGIGISSNQKELIFDSFKQGKSKSKGKFGGTGLGLTISKQLIELQGGEIWVESEEDKGSIFYIELPLIVGEKTEATQKLVGESELKSLGNALKGLRVLVAEDNEFNIMVIKDDLTWYIPEVKITFVENGKLAFETFKKFDFDIILMDVQMPEMNGYKATRKIRKFEKDNNIIKPIAIVAMTASLLKNQIDKCYDAGMDAYIPKPYKAEDFMNTLIKVTQGL
ncbi:ATP-binding protein [Gaetbulibacter aquiaggeris]|uniref:histidine kinase n=1 Tax=Gaetbulibacter aquiaggeris TaxID=1735373 RepID=A0ABW7MSN5_9FLAO